MREHDDAAVRQPGPDADDGLEVGLPVDGAALRSRRRDLEPGSAEHARDAVRQRRVAGRARRPLRERAAQFDQRVAHLRGPVGARRIERVGDVAGAYRRRPALERERDHEQRQQRGQESRSIQAEVEHALQRYPPVVRAHRA